MKQTPIPETSLEFKNHVPFFSSLNNKLDEISELGELTYSNLEQFKQYFAKIKNLFNKHYSYVKKPEDKERQLEDIEKIVYNIDFIKDLSEKRASAISMQYKLFRKTQKILRDIVSDLARSELIPKPVPIEEEVWKSETDKGKQVLLKTVMTMLDNNN